MTSTSPCSGGSGSEAAAASSGVAHSSRVLGVTSAAVMVGSADGSGSAAEACGVSSDCSTRGTASSMTGRTAVASSAMFATSAIDWAEPLGGADGSMSSLLSTLFASVE